VVVEELLKIAFGEKLYPHGGFLQHWVLSNNVCIQQSYHIIIVLLYIYQLDILHQKWILIQY
jgi:hypothetical protein